MLLLARRRLQSEAANHWNAMHMSKSSLDDITMEVICGTCGTGQSKPIGYFRNHSHLTCDGCGSEITFETSNSAPAQPSSDALWRGSESPTYIE